MKITYLRHSGFLVEMTQVWLLFDYYRGEIPAFPKGKKGYVFVSHRHIDHFNKEIFNFLKKQNNITFILSDDIWKKRIPEEAKEQTLLMKPEEERSVDDICIRTLRSTDEGVAFLVSVEGKTIYHAGDLNDWYWKEESEDWNQEMSEKFRKYVEPLRDRKIDAAFIPLNPRQEEYYTLGMDYFLELAKPEKVYPMHFWRKPEIIERWLEEHPQSQDRDRIVRITEEGELFKQ